MSPQPKPLDAARPVDLQAVLLDAMSEDEVLDTLGSPWSQMSAAKREAYGPRVESDELFDRLARFAQADDLLEGIERETCDLLDRIEHRLRAMERKYAATPYRAALARVAAEKGLRG